MMSSPQPDTRRKFRRSDQIKKTSVGIDPLSEATTRTTTLRDRMITKQDHHSSQTKTNPRTGEVTITMGACGFSVIGRAVLQ